MEHRSVPFWSWNGLLEQNELDAQIEGFKKQGMGGFMIHVREGLETPYLGDEFIERIKETVAKARKEGVSAWLYDEDRYSSGMGGGRVPRLGGDAVRAKALSLTICCDYETDDSIQAVYQASILGNELLSCKRIHNWKNPISLLGGEEIYLVMRRHIASPNEWCHGDTYPDNMIPSQPDYLSRRHMIAIRKPWERSLGVRFQGFLRMNHLFEDFRSSLMNRSCLG
ncbi:hypothetical protein HQN89_34615 [Paenibacillus frigoriresistens]|uniref:hypothetical protein n=1 Tax=Paenibacillus alginolyticus TaxID=59839 RepID=UPI001565BD6C|nr:hypothetical protein [Paenibacillus frigoriresistens]NRF95943.1 hypothetical protein [Paenibacillus frigoriresistens]